MRRRTEGNAYQRGYTKAWSKARNAYINLNPLCVHCHKRGLIVPAAVVDHITPHGIDRSRAQPSAEQSSLFWNRDNWQPLCKRCHDRKSLREDVIASPERAAESRPEWLPKPACVVHMVCGPPGSGKSSHVEAKAHPADTVLDLDCIAAELSGLPIYQAGEDWIGPALRMRNALLAALRVEAARHVAWFIASGAGKGTRAWWADKLGADIVVMPTPADECKRRVRADDRRPAELKARQIKAIDEWFSVELGYSMPRIKPATDASGVPMDPAHPWNSGR